MTTMNEIEKRARQFAEARDHMAGIVAAINSAIEAIKGEHIKSLRRAVDLASRHHAALHDLVESAPDLFKEPRAVTLHGIKLGWQKGRQRVEWEDIDVVVQRIHKHLPDKAGLLIQTKETPVRDALAGLDPAMLKKLGVTITEGGDAVFIKPSNSEVDKLVATLL